MGFNPTHFQGYALLSPRKQKIMFEFSLCVRKHSGRSCKLFFSQVKTKMSATENIVIGRYFLQEFYAGNYHRMHFITALFMFVNPLINLRRKNIWCCHSKI